jgi:hypothetical protein
MFSLLLFVIKNKDLYKSNFEIHSINTRHGKPTDLHSLIFKLTKLQKGAFCFGIKIFNHLPSRTDDLSHEEKRLRLPLQKLLLMNSFYTLDQYFNCKLSKDFGSL